MNSQATLELDQEIATVVEVVVKRTVSFMREELGQAPTGVKRHDGRPESLQLRDVTAIVSVGCYAGLYIAFSYDDSLIRAMMRRYTAEIGVAPDEEELYIQETASDVVNVIVGNCTAELSKQRESVSLSPPVLMLGARKISGRPGTSVSTLTLQFQEGLLDLAFVGPKVMFDERLNFLGGAI
jgi:CheY-specific phosphatase CheX